MTDTNKIKKLAKLDEIDRLRAERDAALARVAELEKQEPVAWVEVIDRDYGPYNFHGKRLLPKGKHQLYAAPVAQAQHSVPEEWHGMLANLQWHYEPYDDHYHRDQGFYCPVCGGEKDEGHKQGCNLAKLIATADLKEDKK